MVASRSKVPLAVAKELRFWSGMRIPVSLVIGLAEATSARATVSIEALQNMVGESASAEALTRRRLGAGGRPDED